VSTATIKQITVKAPASIANLGPGFDVCAIALKSPYDVVHVKVKPGSGSVYVTSRGFNVPGGRENCAYAVTEEFMNRYDVRGLDIYIEVEKGIPPSRGLGSSGATSAATAYALATLFNQALTPRELLELAGVGEAFVAGTPHYDNVAASLFGGFVIVDPATRSVVKHVLKKEVVVAVIIPQNIAHEIARKTEYARSLLPAQIPLETHVKQASALAKLVYGVVTGDLKLLGEAISTDYIAEPYRSRLIPHYSELKKIALESGALGFNIAGAGPSAFFIHEDQLKARSIGEKLVEFLKTRGIDAYLHITTISQSGVEPSSTRSNPVNPAKD